ncbi:MAG TPA: glycoside hydrolase family 125 protein [Verrucomicrobiae bacterium]|nr:glycoside hydrolase family 125 protein [Verrucomicrobiae bacterium]
MNRREFIQSTSLITTGLMLGSVGWAKDSTFPTVRISEAERKFKSVAVEKTIRRIQSAIGNRELAWMFGNCFPNTLDTTVDFEVVHGRPDTYVITGDIDAMWLRDSSAQVWPYLPLTKEDAALQQLIAGVIDRQTRCILLDPYANAFYKDPNKISPWKTDLTGMKPGIHERKWEVDSLCHPIRLAHGYWKITGDTTPFDGAWREAVLLILKTFREQQRKDGPGPYHFQRRGTTPSDTLMLDGYGNPARPVGLIFSMFRPSDDATIFPLLVPSNFFAVVSLRQAAELLEQVHQDAGNANACRLLADEVEKALRQYAVIHLPGFGRGYAYEVDGYGSHNCMDDANVPDLLSLPYLEAVNRDDPLYQDTRRWLLSAGNPYYFKGRAAEGLGGPHIGWNMIWPLGLITQGMTSTDDGEIRDCLETLQRTQAGTGFMHESFDRDNPAKFTRPWFAWANTMFGEFILKVYAERPHLLD